MKKPVGIFYEVFADRDNVNAQSLNARGIALRLNRERFRSSFLASGSPDPRLFGQAHIRLIVLPPRLRSLFARAALRCSPDSILVYPNSLFHPAGWGEKLGSALRKKKMVYPLEEPIDFIKEENPRGFEEVCRLLGRSDSVVPISEHTAQVLELETGIRAPLTIPLGIDSRFFFPREREEFSPVRVLFAGRLIARKGPDKVLEAASRFPAAHFRLIGSALSPQDEKYARQLRHRVAREELKNVEFIGKVSQEGLRSHLWESDLLLHPSSVEGIPRVTLEAGATGIPSIVFDSYRTPSVVDGVTGFQVKTVEEMMDRLGQLIADRGLRRKMGAAAVEHVKQFDWAVLARRWEKVFAELAQN